jgi:putative transposase
MSNYKRVFDKNKYVFITIVTFNRKPLLVKNINLLRQSFRNALAFYDFEIFGIVVLPDHIHIIVKPKNIEEYPNIISNIKHSFSKNIDLTYFQEKEKLSASKIKKREKGIWQRRYWEHTIRDENDLYKHLDYIHFNPVKHNMAENVKNWKYSSFHKFVKLQYYEKNWGSMSEISHIQNLNFE